MTQKCFGGSDWQSLDHVDGVPIIGVRNSAVDDARAAAAPSVKGQWAGDVERARENARRAKS